MDDSLGVLHYTWQHVEKITKEYEAVTAQRDTLRATLLQVVACFKSRAESSTCVEDHHPSCLAFIESRLKE